MPIRVGDQVPDFTLKDHTGTEITLSSLRGKNVVLSFHPLAWTKVCAQQMGSLEAAYERFRDHNTVALGISVDSVPCKKAWAAQELKISHTSLLSDFWPHGGLARTLGLFREQDGFSERANVIIDVQGRVRFIKIYELSELPDIEEILSQIIKEKGE